MKEGKGRHEIIANWCHFGFSLIVRRSDSIKYSLITPLTCSIEVNFRENGKFRIEPVVFLFKNVCRTNKKRDKH